ERAPERDDAGGGDGAGADVVDVVRPNLARRHVGDELTRGEDRRGEPRAEELDRRNQREPRQHAAAEQVPRDARSDDIAHASELGADLRLDLAEELRSRASDRTLERAPRHLEPQMET